MKELKQNFTSYTLTLSGDCDVCNTYVVKINYRTSIHDEHTLGVYIEDVCVHVDQCCQNFHLHFDVQRYYQEVDTSKHEDVVEILTDWWKSFAADIFTPLIELR